MNQSKWSLKQLKYRKICPTHKNSDSLLPFPYIYLAKRKHTHHPHYYACHVYMFMKTFIN